MWAAFVGPAAAQTSPAAPPVGPNPARAPDLVYETGRVTVKGGIATIDLPPGWRYLQQDGARYVVEKVWRNQANHGTLGLVVPPRSDDWGGVVVSYDQCGHVADRDAADLDADAILRALQANAAIENVDRRRAGFTQVEILGWAVPPHYEAAAKKLYWAKSMRPIGSAAPLLNFDMRVLGADGVLVLQAVSDLDKLAKVAAGARELLARTEIAAGRRYSDHDPAVHRVADHGIVRLILGRRVVKVGLARVLLRVLLVFGVVAALAFTKALRSP